MFALFLIFTMIVALVAIHKYAPHSERVVWTFALIYAVFSLWLLGNGLWIEFFTGWVFVYVAGLVTLVILYVKDKKPAEPTNLGNLTDSVYGQADLTEREE